MVAAEEHRARAENLARSGQDMKRRVAAMRARGWDRSKRVEGVGRWVGERGEGVEGLSEGGEWEGISWGNREG